MAKMYTYIIIISGLMILMNLAGLQTLSGTALAKMGILNIDSLSGTESSFFYAKVVAVIALLIGTATAITIGTFGRNSSDTIAWATIATALFVFFVGDIANVAVVTAKETEPWIGYLIFAIMAPFILGYLISILDWIKGSD